jgi:multiple sugar transport system permease protein
VPLLTEVSYRSFPVKIGIGLLYFVLIVGGITMVYPFALMVATSFTSEIDSDELRLVPRFLHDDEALYQKYLSSKYGTFAGKFATLISIELFNQVHDHERQVFSFQNAAMPRLSRFTDEQNAALLDDWKEFRVRMAEEHPGSLRAFFLGRPGWMPAWTIAGEGVDDYRHWVAEKFEGEIPAINEAYGESLPEDGSILHLLPQSERHRSPLWLPDLDDPQYRDWLRWEQQTSMRFADVFPLYPSWHRYLENHPDLQSATDDNVARRINVVWETDYESLLDFPLSEQSPKSPEQRKYWKSFVRESLSRMYLRFQPGLGPLFASALEQEFGSPEEMRLLTKTDYETFDAVPVPETVFDVSGQFRSVLLQLVSGRAGTGGDPLDHVTLVIPEAEYASYLQERYGNIETVNERYGWDHKSFAGVRIPRARLDRLELAAVRGHYLWWMLGRNYRMVGTFIAGHGRALFNTFVLCAGAIFFTLTVNPLCAYALSRYGLSSTNKILIYLLATMAFPPSVAMIPSFLLLRDLHLLNTYWALLLPAAANGFTIFMMKGFFDTLPREVFEAAKIDGATELRMFFRILLPLCKPVFGFFALGAFTSAYSGFIWAFTICPKEEMWTMMVWLYQLTTMQPAGVQMAALVIAALPTLLVFTVVQNIILKGIVLPTYH